MENYNISLGILLDTSSLKGQISKIDNVHKINLGVQLDTKNIKSQLQSLNSKNLLSLDTSTLNASLDKVEKNIMDIKTAMGTLDSAAGMKSLLTSINQISGALDRAEKQFKELNTSLSSLAGKNFSINLGINMGSGNAVSRNTAYGNLARTEVIPQLQQQAAALENYLAKYYKVAEGINGVSKLIQGTNVVTAANHPMTLLPQMADGSNLSKQMGALKQYIALIKEAASVKGVDLTSVTSKFTQSADQLVTKAQNVQSGTAQMQESMKQLQGIFGSGINSEKLSSQLDSIVADLGEIRNSLQTLSQNTSLEKLTSVFNNLSIVLDKVVANAGNVQTALGSGLSGSGSSISGVTESIKIADIKITDMANHTKSLQDALGQLGFNKGSIDTITKDFTELGISVTNVTTRLRKDGSVTLTVKGIDQYERAVTMMKSVASDGSLTNLGTSISQSFKETEVAFSRLKSLINEIGNTKVKIDGLDANKNKAEIDELTSYLNKLEAEYNELYSITSKNLNSSQLDALAQSAQKTNDKLAQLNAKMSDVSVAKNQSQAFKELMSVLTQLNSKKINLAEIGGATSSKSNQARALLLDIHNLKAEYKGLLTTFRSQGISFSSEQWNQIKIAMMSTGNAISSVKAKHADARAEMAKGIQGNFGKYNNQIASLEGRINGLNTKTPELVNSFNRVKQALSTLKSADGTESIIASYKKFLSLLQQVEMQLRKNKTAEENAANVSSLDISKQNLSLKMDNWLQNNSAAAKQFGGEIERLKAKLKSCGNTSAVKQVGREFQNVTLQAKKANVATLSFGDRLKKQFSQYSTYFSVHSLFMYGTRAIRSMFNQVKEIDSAMTELKKVTDETEESYSRFLSNAATRSKEIGTTISGLVDSTADFARLGYSFEDAQGLAEVANIYAVVGDEIEGVEQATESLISTMAAFKDQADGMSNTDFAMEIIDKFNEIGNNFAISSGGIGEALERSASSLDAANNTIDESIALITAANTVVQDPEQVGTAFKTISMRIRGAKTELEEAGLETEGMVESTAKLREEILALTGVDIMENEDTFKSTYRIMDELSAKWKDLTDIQQASVTELIAGKRQGNIVSSLMTNFDTAREALETSMNSTGSAMAEHEKWMESLEARLNKLKATWQSLSQSFMSSSFLKVLLDVVIGFINAIDVIIDKIGVIPTIIGAIGIGKLIVNLVTLSGGIMSLGDVATVLTITFPKLTAAVTAFFAAFKDGLTLTSLKTAFSGLWTVIAQHPFIATAAAIAICAVAIDKFTESAEELADRIEGVTSKYKEQHDALIKVKGDYDTSNEDSLISKYERLSKGVNSLGENVSLTAGEYEEYQSIINTVAEQMPELVTGYNSQGQAILECAGNVDALAEAYRNLIKEQNKEVLETGNDILKDFNNDVNKLLHSQGVKGTTKAHDSGMIEQLSSVGHLKTLEDILKSEDLESAISNLSSTDAKRISDLLEENGLERDKLGSGEKGYETYQEFIIRAIKENTKEVKSALTDAFNDVNAHVEDLNTYTEAYFSTAFLGGDGNIGDYSNFSDKMQNIISQITSGFDVSFYEQFESIEELEDYLGSMLSAFDNEDVSTKIETAFDLRTKFNGGEISYGEYVKGIQNAEQTINSLGLDEEVASQLKLSLNTEEVKNEYYALNKRLVEMSTKSLKKYGHFSGMSDAIKVANEDVKKFLDSLTVSEYAVAIDLIINDEIDLNNFNIESLREYIKEQAMLKEAMNFTIAMDVETESISALNSALAESVSATGLSSESIASLKSRYAELEDKGYDLSAMFEETSNGIHLNKKAVSELEQEYAKSKLSETQDNIDVLKDRYDELTVEIDNCTDASERAALYREQQSIVDKINDLGTLASQYEGLASAYSAWQNMESSGSERDMYEGIIEGFENIEDELSRGWLDDGTIKFLELMTGQTDLAGESTSKLKGIWDSLDDTIKNTSYSVTDFFTVDEDGNSTSAGVYNFLRAIQELESSDVFENVQGNIEDLVKIKDGKVVGFDFSIVGGDEAIAEALGISEELVQIMVRAADDAGFVVTIDGNWTQFADLKDQAEAANDSIKLLAQTNEDLKNAGFGEYEFNFGSGSIEEINTDLEKAKELLNSDAFKNTETGKLDLSINGAKEALKIVETLQIAKSQLEEPSYMSIDVTGLEIELQKPVQLLQDFENTAQTIDLLNLTPDINVDKIKELDEELNVITEQLYNLEEEQKIKIGIEGKTPEEIREELENGTIEIPTELTIEASMDKSLEDLVTLGLLEQGLIDEKTAKIRLGLEVEIDEAETEKHLTERISEATSKPILSNAIVNISNLIGDYTSEEKEVVLKFLADTSEYDKFEAKDKEAVVKFLADTIDVEDYTPEEKQAYARYIVDGGDVEGYTPEQKQAIVEYLTDSENIDSWTPEQKEGIAKFITDCEDVDDYTPEQKFAIAKFIKDSIEVDNYQMPTNKWAYAKYLKDTYDIDIWTPDPKDGVVNYTPTLGLFSATRSLTPPTLYGTAMYTPKISGVPKVDGTAHANGTTGRAFKQGDWGTKKTETALTGELGQELVVYGNRYWTVGDNGAEFANIPKGSIVFNHKQTEELFKNGKVTSDGGRGKFYANGTAFAQGTAFSGGTGGLGEPDVTSYSVDSNPSSKKKKKKDTKDTKDTKEEFKETIDWVEIAIQRIEREIDKLDQKANNVYQSWSSRNTALTKEISKVGDEIALQEDAYDRYIQEANSVGLSEKYASQVRNGTIDISTIKDEALAEKIKDYQTWYEKALACKDSVDELKETESKLYAQRFENVQAQYDGILQGYEHTESMLNEYISQAEAKGHIVSKEYYQALINNEKSNIAQLQKEQADLIEARDEAVASGKIKKGSEEWYNMCSEIDGVTQEIEAANTEILEFAKNIEEIDWSVFDLIQERISNISSEADFLIELMSNDKLYDDNGKLTGQGAATMGLHALNHNTYMYQADDYGAEVARLDKQIAKDPYDQELIKRRNELLELQRESILNAENEKQAIKDLVEEGINKELDALQDLIDKKNEELESEKDLYEYQKKVREQTEEIASLEKQMAAYSGDTSEEAKAKIQELKVSLDDAKEELKETEWDKYIQDTSAMLDTLYTEYETILNARLDNVDYLLQQVIDGINASASLSSENNSALLSALGSDGTIAAALGVEGAIASSIVNAVGENGSIKNILNTEATSVGTKLSNEMNSIWSVGEGNAKSILTTYGEGFQNKQTTTNTTLDNIKIDVAKMVSSLSKEAEKKVEANKTSTSAKKDPTKETKSTATNNKTTTTNKTTTSAGDGKPKVGDKVKFVSGQYYYDSQGKKPLGSKYQGKQVYITKINDAKWATYPYHISTGSKLGSGDLGWLKLNQISGYATGNKKLSNSEIAWTQENGKEFIVRPSDGAILTPLAKGDSVLNAKASQNIWNMANSPSDFIKDNLNLGGANIPNNSNVQNYTQHLENVVFSLPNVKNYEELLQSLSKDPKFERLLNAMTVDRYMGKSSLAKRKAIR